MADETKNTKQTPTPVLTTPLTPEQQKEAAAAREEAKAKAVEGVDARLKEAEERALAQAERQEKSKPTPTQRETDLAKVGALDIDSKEPSGAETEEEAAERRYKESVPVVHNAPAAQTRTPKK